MRKYLLLLLVLCVLTACDKRYEEGPCLSFIKAENRVCGTWNIAQATIGNNPVEGAASDTLSAFQFAFNMNSGKALFLSLSDASGTIIAETLVRENERLTTLTFGMQTITGYEAAIAPLLRIFPALSTEQIWEITRLKREEMWIRAYIQGQTYELHFALIMDYQSL